MTETAKRLLAEHGNAGVSDTAKRIAQQFGVAQTVGSPRIPDATQFQPQGPVGAVTDDQVAAATVGQKTLATGSLANVFARLDVAQADTIGEKLKALQKTYPDAELVRVPATGELLFRTQQSEGFRRLDDPSFEPINDMIDIFGSDVLPVIGEIAATVGQKGKNLLPIIGRLFLGGFAGEEVEQLIQSGRGIQEQTGSEAFLQEPLQTGVLSGAGGVIGGAAVKGLDVARGVGLFGLKPGGREALQAAEEIAGFPGMTVGQVVDSPLLKKIEGQSGATMPSVGRFVTAQNDALVTALDTIKDSKSAAQLLKGDAAALMDAEKEKVLKMMVDPKVSASAAGQMIQEGVARYDAVSRAAVSRYYKEARDIAPRGQNLFDMSGLKETATKLIEGIPAEGVGRLDPLNKDMATVLDKVMRLDPSLPPVTTESGRVVDGIDQLQALRSQLYDLKTPPPGETMRAEHFQAAELYKSLTDTMKNVQGNPEFKAKWAKANFEAAKRFETLDKIIVSRAAKSETPAQLADRLAKPLQVDNLKVLRSIIPENEFSLLQDSFKSKLIRSPRDIDRTMKSFDQETLDILMSKGDQKLMGKISSEYRKLENIGFDKIAETQTVVTRAAENLLLRGDTASIDRIAKIVADNGGVDSSVGKMFRGALIEAVYNKSVKAVGAVTEVDGKALNKLVSEIEGTDLMKILTPDDLRMVKNVNLIKQLVKSGADAGTSIEAASVAEQARGVLTGTADAAVLKDLFELVGVGRMLVNPLFRSIAIGSGKLPSDKSKTALVSAILTQTADDIVDLDSKRKKVIEAVQ